MEKQEKEFSEIKVVLIGGSAGLFKSKKLKALAKLSKEIYFFNLLIDWEGSFKNFKLIKILKSFYYNIEK